MDGRQRQADCQASKTPRCASVRDTRTPERTFAAVRSEPRRTGWAAAWNGKPYPFAAKGRRRLADEAEHTTPHRGAEVLGNHATQGAAAFVAPAGVKAQRDGGVAMPSKSGRCRWRRPGSRGSRAATPIMAGHPRSGQRKSKKKPHIRTDNIGRNLPISSSTRARCGRRPQGRPCDQPRCNRCGLGNPGTPRCALPVGAPGGGYTSINAAPHQINHVHACIQKEEYFVL